MNLDNLAAKLAYSNITQVSTTIVVEPITIICILCEPAGSKNCGNKAAKNMTVLGFVRLTTIAFLNKRHSEASRGLLTEPDIAFS